MVDLVAEAVRLEAFLQSQGWRYCFIGGLAVQHWGEPRLTRDLDLCLLTGFGREASYIDALLAVYLPRMAGGQHAVPVEMLPGDPASTAKEQSGIGC